MESKVSALLSRTRYTQPTMWYCVCGMQRSNRVWINEIKWNVRIFGLVFVFLICECGWWDKLHLFSTPSVLMQFDRNFTKQILFKTFMFVSLASVHTDTHTHRHTNAHWTPEKRHRITPSVFCHQHENSSPLWMYNLFVFFFSSLFFSSTSLLSARPNQFVSFRFVLVFQFGLLHTIVKSIAFASLNCTFTKTDTHAALWNISSYNNII